jgi:hypothetical protein
MGFLRACLLFVALVSSAHADVVSDWNDKALRATYNARLTNFPEIAEIFATLSVSMFDAVNAVERQYEPYLFGESVPLGASAEAAAIGAAYTVLIKIFPEQSSIFSNAREKALLRISNATKRSDGYLIGEQAATAILKARQGHKVFTINRWRPITAPGVYIPTTFPVDPSLPTAKPWLLSSADQFRPKPLPALTSEEFAKDYNETREIGSVQSSIRTADQTQAARFWAMSGVHGWNRGLSQLVASSKASLLEHARCRALLNMALADSFIAAWDAKYYFNFWRPVTAIRNGDRTGNANTPADPGWLPLIETPLHPEYPSGHSANLGAAITVLEPFVKTIGSRPFVVTSEESPGVVRRFATIQEMGDEIANARVWAGIHFRSACIAGNELGRNIGRYALENYLKPIQGRNTQ